MRNFKSIEDSLKHEINDVLDKRREVEETREELKERVCKDAIRIRQLLGRIEILESEKLMCEKELDNHRTAEHELKLTIEKCDRELGRYRRQFQERESELHELQSDRNRIARLLEHTKYTAQFSTSGHHSADSPKLRIVEDAPLHAHERIQAIRSIG